MRTSPRLGFPVDQLELGIVADDTQTEDKTHYPEEDRSGDPLRGVALEVNQQAIAGSWTAFRWLVIVVSY